VDLLASLEEAAVVKEAVFHPEARAEVEQSVEFHETRLDGLGLRSISACPEAGAPLAGGLRKRIVSGFPYSVIYRVWEDYVYLVMKVRHSPDVVAARSVPSVTR
jgi:hypothetical protein